MSSVMQPITRCDGDVKNNRTQDQQSYASSNEAHSSSSSSSCSSSTMPSRSRKNEISFSIEALLGSPTASQQSPITVTSETDETPPAMKRPDELLCQLESKELWTMFNKLGMEMIVTKTGRRMFPVLSVTLSGLRSDCVYDVFLDFVPLDGLRYRYSYHRSCWLPTAPLRSSVSDGGSGHFENSSSFLGPSWLGTSLPYRYPDVTTHSTRLAASQFGDKPPNEHVIAFDKLKLTNCPNSGNASAVFLYSMTKYQPRIHVIQYGDMFRYNPVAVKKFVFAETTFMSVTAYQNQMITQLKIEYNPFAKGFRRKRFSRSRDNTAMKLK